MLNETGVKWTKLEGEDVMMNRYDQLEKERLPYVVDNLIPLLSGREDFKELLKVHVPNLSEKDLEDATTYCEQVQILMKEKKIPSSSVKFLDVMNLCEAAVNTESSFAELLTQSEMIRP